MQGVAILCAVLVVVTVSAVNDYQKEQQFRALSAVKDDVQVRKPLSSSSQTKPSYIGCLNKPAAARGSVLVSGLVGSLL